MTPDYCMLTKTADRLRKKVDDLKGNVKEESSQRKGASHGGLSETSLWRRCGNDPAVKVWYPSAIILGL